MCVKFEIALSSSGKLPGLCTLSVFCLTAGAAGVRIHEGKGHPFILLQSALVCETALHGAHMALLLPVGNGCLIHIHWFPIHGNNTGEIVIDGERKREEEKGNVMFSNECYGGKNIEQLREKR